MSIRTSTSEISPRRAISYIPVPPAINLAFSPYFLRYSTTSSSLSGLRNILGSKVEEDEDSNRKHFAYLVIVFELSIFSFEYLRLEVFGGVARYFKRVFPQSYHYRIAFSEALCQKFYLITIFILLI